MSKHVLWGGMVWRQSDMLGSALEADVMTIHDEWYMLRAFPADEHNKQVKLAWSFWAHEKWSEIKRDTIEECLKALDALIRDNEH